MISLIKGEAMQKRWLTLLLIMLYVSVMTVVAQDEESSFRVWSPIDSITANLTKDITRDGEILVLELMITGKHTDACMLELMTEQASYDTHLDIQIYRKLSPSMSCLRQDTPFETTIVLDRSLSEMPSHIIINDQVWAVTLPEGDTISTDDLPTFEEVTLVSVMVDDVIMTRIDGENPVYEIALTGSHGVGCDVPVIYSVRELAESMAISVFNPMPELAICPMMIIILDETIEISATLIADDTLVTVNTTLINQLETQAMSDSIKVMTNINSVTVNVMESMPMQISLNIAGEHPDGCQLPVVVDQSRNGNTIQVDIYREVPADMMCPMMLNPYDATIKLDGTFDAGGYTITVNEVTRSVDI
jgi:hypothetical protein